MKILLKERVIEVPDETAERLMEGAQPVKIDVYSKGSVGLSGVTTDTRVEVTFTVDFVEAESGGKPVYIEGTTVDEDGDIEHHIRVLGSPTPYDGSNLQVWIDDKEIGVSNVNRLRDGGTTIITLVNADQITAHRRLGAVSFESFNGKKIYKSV